VKLVKTKVEQKKTPSGGSNYAGGSNYKFSFTPHAYSLVQQGGYRFCAYVFDRKGTYVFSAERLWVGVTVPRPRPQ
jgi:hypothetical protein